MSTPDDPASTAARRRAAALRLLHPVAIAALALGLAIPATTARADTGPVAAYSFDEGTGSSLTDSSGNGRTGTIVGASWTAGKNGSALSFNGTSSRVDLPALGTFYKTGFTLEAWVKKAGTAKDVGIVGSWDWMQNGGAMLWVDHVAGHYYATLGAGLSTYVDSGQSPAPGTWQHLTATYDGATARFYLDGTQVATRAFAGNVGDANVWRIGAYGPTAGNFFDGAIDDVRIYDHTLTAAQVTADMSTRVPFDTTPPTAPAGFVKTGSGFTTIATSWTASTDANGVAGYRAYRAGSLIATTASTSYTFAGLTCNTGYPLGVEAFDAAGNTSSLTALTASTGACDTTAPSVTLTAPANGATVGGTANVSATASDNDGVAGVQFKMDGANLGSEDTTSPYQLAWDTTSVAPGSHTLTAVARDPSGNTATSAAATVTVTAPPAGSGPLAAYSFDDGAGTIAGDATGQGRQGTIANATWAAGKYGSALSFNGTNARVDLPSLGTFYDRGFTLEAWVKRDSAKVDEGILGSWDAAKSGGPMIWVDHIAGHYYATFNAGMSNYLDSGQPAATATWQHVAATYDGTTARFYVNGAQVATKAYSGDVGDTDRWRVGAYGGASPDGFLDGDVDDVRIYSRALTTGQVQADMATPVTSALAVVGTTPASGSDAVGASPAIAASFNLAVDASTITTSTFQLRDGDGIAIPGSATFDAATGKASFTPTAALSYGVTYTATIKSGASGVKSASGAGLGTDRSWTVKVMARPPILLLTQASRPFGAYAGEILQAEGLSEFTQLDLSLATSPVLSGFDEVVLGDATLTPAQVTLLTSYVNGGGKLVALRPDKQLAGLLGLFDLNSTLSNAYLKVDTSAGQPGAGIVGDTVQFHGAADRYLLNGATAIATLYSNATTATISPAVTLRSVGANGGQAAAFTYDLARSVVYTRQGNPGWAGQDRDGLFPIRTNDLFFGARTGDLQPDWVDLSKVSIPQADEQQRLLANVLNTLSSGRKPLPRFWYLPGAYKAAVVMTGDDHAQGGTAGRFDTYLAAGPAGCSVAEWQCVRSTSYVYPGGPMTDAQAQAYASKGFEIALHVAPAGVNDLSCANWTPSALGGIFDTQLEAWQAKYGSLPSPVTHRMHCVSWTDWATQAKVELAHGMRLDTNYYYYPGSWIGAKPGFMTGSGEIMRFADTDGSLIDVYQAATQMSDESGQAQPSTIDALLNNAVGANGYYGAFVANIHTDHAASADSDAIVAAARSRGVPIVSAKQLLDWTDGRNRSSFDALGWTGGTLTFKLAPDAGANGLQAMLPLKSGAKTLQSVTLSGVPVATTTRTIKGVDYGFFDAAAGSYTAVYA